MCRSVPMQLIAVLAVVGALRPAPAAACGGLFCSGGGGGPTQAGGVVNQTAERIVFIHNDDQTVTAVIQILYEGPADKFAWIIPIAGVPEVEVSSTSVLDQLQARTNPAYTASIQRMCPPPPSSGSSGFSCPCPPCGGAAPGSPTSAAGSGGGAAPMPVVTVEASGAIGPYDYAVISVDAGLLDPAEVALKWLRDNEFDATETAADALRPYLLEDMNLLAFKLQKSADVGSIRPVMLTYPAEQSSIPIRPTAVAAEEDMSVLVWVLAKTQAVPLNYKSVVLNEARIDWFRPGMNYDTVVSEAADEAGGQAFVTEFAGQWPGGGIFADLEQRFATYRQRLYTDWAEALRQASNWMNYDGFDEALQAAATLPPELTVAELKMCVQGLAGPSTAAQLESCLRAAGGEQFAQVRVDIDKFIAELEAKAIAPIVATEKRIASQPYLTRLYTKLSPQEMTLDPVFGENAAAPSVSNAHMARGTSDCQYTMATLNLPLGVQVLANPNGVWPVDAEESPAALKVLQYGTSGEPLVVADETATVMGKRFGVSQCAGGLPGTAGRGGSGGSGGNSARAGTGGNAAAGNGGGFLMGPNGEPFDDGDGSSPEDEDDGCSALPGAGHDAASHWALGLIALGALACRRRTRRCAPRP